VTTPADIEWEAPVLEPTRDAALGRYVRQALGVIPPAVPYFYPCPWVVRAIVAFDASRLGLAHIDSRTAALIELVVSQDNACRYCYAATRAMLKILGFSEQRIRSVERDLLGAELEPKVRLALDFARHVSRANPSTAQQDVERLLTAGYSREAVKELALVAAVTVFFNRVATLPAIPTDAVERLDRSPMMRTVFPLLVWLGSKRRSEPRPLPATRPDGPYAYVTEALGGLSVGAVLGGVLDDAWQSSILPPRTKAFLFAVVARGLSCVASEQEAQRLLAAEGVPTQTVEETLAHLTADALDPVERTAVPFARETIWYRPTQIQRRARAVRAQLTRDQFLELVGIVSLANTLCRLSVAILPR
jgi:AhpD family alkylhydroperoxidase